MDDLKNLMKGVEVTDVKDVSRKPGEKPFATEIFYKKETYLMESCM